MIKWLVLGLSFLCFATGVLAEDKVIVRVEAPGNGEIKLGEKITLEVVVEAGGARLSAVDVDLSYDSTKMTVNKVTMGEAMSKLKATEAGGVVSLAGVIMSGNSDLVTGRINLGTIEITGKTAGKIGFTLKRMEIVGYGAGKSVVGVVSEYGGMVATGASALPTSTGAGTPTLPVSNSDCKKANLDLSSKDVGMADGNVDTLDYSFAKTRALARARANSGGLLMADINGDCIENMADLGLIIRQMILKMESL
ncbi:MAG: cohesin domain-containing protein [Candidatus Shapirobacteria bacterium]|jgi:hypothetical protein